MHESPAPPASGLAPIALFTFKRPEHTRRTLEALARNAEFEKSPLFVFCDGARRANEEEAVEQTRAIVREWPHPNKTIVEAKTNQGLSKSITGGVGQLCESHGKVIVLEDDLITAPGFLSYMNRALDIYAQEPRVMQISGHMFPLATEDEQGACFLPLTTSWGWATWRRAWPAKLKDSAVASRAIDSIAKRYRFDFGGGYPYSRMLADQIAGKNDSWAVWWHLYVYSRNGISLFPNRSFISNEGMDGSGTHSRIDRGASSAISNHAIKNFPAVKVSSSVQKTLRSHLVKSRGFLRFIKDNYWRLRGHNIDLPAA